MPVIPAELLLDELEELEDPPLVLPVVPLVPAALLSPFPLELLLTDSLSDSPESGGVRASSPADAVGDSGWASGACCGCRQKRL